MSAEKLAEALRFYADPVTYLGVGFRADPPCAEIVNDTSEVADATGFVGRRLGKRAREALAAHAAEQVAQEPSAECWRKAVEEAFLVRQFRPSLAWIEQRARELQEAK